jgi:hypothetical protein
MDAYPQNISHLAMALPLLDNKLENEVLPLVSYNNYKRQGEKKKLLHHEASL